MEHVPPKVTATMNEQLTWPFAASEVERAVFLMGAHKAPGSDGLTAGFFQLHWDLMGPDIIEAVLNFQNGGAMPDGLNRTTIVLIPKTSNPKEMKEFRLISLCNVLCKIC